MYNYVNEKKQIKHSIKALNLKDSNCITTDQKVIANALNGYFESVFNVDKDQIFPSFEFKTSKVCDPAPNVLFSYNQIVQKLENLDANKSMGPDMIHSFVIKKCAKAFAVPLNIMYQKSFEIGELPTIWKQANVTPLHKGGNKLDPANYRPVSLTCVLCKVMESLVKDSMLKHLLDI